MENKFFKDFKAKINKINQTANELTEIKNQINELEEIGKNDPVDNIDFIMGFAWPLHQYMLNNQPLNRVIDICNQVQKDISAKRNKSSQIYADGMRRGCAELIKLNYIETSNEHHKDIIQTYMSHISLMDNGQPKSMH